MYFFIQFRKNSQKSSALWHNFFNGISRRACYLSKKDILIKVFMGMFSQVTVIEPARHFLTSSKKKFFCRFVINAPYLSTSPFGWFWVLLEKDHCFSINFGHQFRNLLPDFYRNFSPGFFGAAFYVYRGTFIGISSENVFLCLSDTRSLFFGLWAKVLARVF